MLQHLVEDHVCQQMVTILKAHLIQSPILAYNEHNDKIRQKKADYVKKNQFPINPPLKRF